VRRGIGESPVIEGRKARIGPALSLFKKSGPCRESLAVNKPREWGSGRRRRARDRARSSCTITITLPQCFRKRHTVQASGRCGLVSL